VKEETLVEQINSRFKTDDLKPFFELLKTKDISDACQQKAYLNDLSEQELEKMKGDAFRKRLSAIEKHKLFKFFLSNENFSEAYHWLDNQKAPQQYKTPEAKINIIHAVVSSFIRYAWRVKGEPLEPSEDDLKIAIKLINRSAKNFIELIEDHYDDLENNLKKCCDNSMSRLRYMAQYKPLKPLRRDKTYNERSFLDNLVRSLRKSGLRPSRNFIALLLPALGESDFGLDSRNLVLNIRTCEERYEQERKQEQGRWQFLLEKRK
jgi:hypothetical protein